MTTSQAGENKHCSKNLCQTTKHKILYQLRCPCHPVVAVSISQAIEEEARIGKEKEKELVGGNPLLALAGDVTFNVKRRCACIGGRCVFVPG